ncbi:hypothetical protein, variant 3 [Aphanomyces astaci]|uniref:Leucine-rich repeat-containing N-terminal plant-type domain-containing protein n=1 Tax=Aphanomyces astaci TaxID=112090 RepID=W4G424_APHAT|nr:hypothetical protein, variant 3 [Aphanomyces astaci]ETV74462.1 hypothetical protein, variant 3 [Aphanomyces astaci]|eukprot:XP_009836120.1 hypothetical protein, variant 3 [Aphanomyces astaci]
MQVPRQFMILLLAAGHVVRAQNATTLWGVCPETIIAPTDMAMCLQEASGAIVPSPKSARDVDLTARGIQVVGSLPSEAASLNLSNNSIRDIPAYVPNSQLTALNLTFNAFTQASALALPPSITTLDLSHNFITRLFRWTALDNSFVTTLILKNNRLSMIRETVFPSTLMHLCVLSMEFWLTLMVAFIGGRDLTGNPLRSFDVSPATFALLTKPNFVLKLDRPLAADVVATCVGAPMLLPNHPNTYLCVYNGSHEDVSSMAFGMSSQVDVIYISYIIL